MNEQVIVEQGNVHDLVDLKIMVSRDLFVAYQRCSWIIVHETGKMPLEVMQEMVHDFLVKHGC